MRITTSDGYYHPKIRGFHECPLLGDDCDRHYCSEHRLLWRDCDTAKPWTQGDRDVIGGTRTVYENGDCPACEWEENEKRYERQRAAREAQEKAQAEWDKLKAISQNYNDRLKGGL